MELIKLTLFSNPQDRVCLRRYLETIIHYPQAKGLPEMSCCHIHPEGHE